MVFSLFSSFMNLKVGQNINSTMKKSIYELLKSNCLSEKISSAGIFNPISYRGGERGRGA